MTPKTEKKPAKKTAAKPAAKAEKKPAKKAAAKPKPEPKPAAKPEPVAAAPEPASAKPEPAAPAAPPVELIDLNKLAQELRQPMLQVRKMVQTGQIPGVKVEGEWRFNLQLVREAMLRRSRGR